MPYRNDFSYFLSDSDSDNDRGNDRGNYFVYFLGDDGEVYSVLSCEAYRRVPQDCKVYDSEYEATRASKLLRFRLSQAKKPQPPEEPPTQSDVQPPPPQPKKPHPLTNMYHGKPTDADWRRRPDGTYNNRPNDPDYYKNYMKNYKNDKVQCDICRSVLVSRNLERHKRISKNCLKNKNILEQQTV